MRLKLPNPATLRAQLRAPILSTVGFGHCLPAARLGKGILHVRHRKNAHKNKAPITGSFTLTQGNDLVKGILKKKLLFSYAGTAGDRQKTKTARGGTYLTPGGEDGVDAAAVSYLDFVQQSIEIIKQDEVSTLFLVQLGEVAGAQLVGKENTGMNSV